MGLSAQSSIVYPGGEYWSPDRGFFIPIYDNEIFKVRYTFQRQSGSRI